MLKDAAQDFELILWYFYEVTPRKRFRTEFSPQGSQFSQLKHTKLPQCSLHVSLQDISACDSSMKETDFT